MIIKDFCEIVDYSADVDNKDKIIHIEELLLQKVIRQLKRNNVRCYKKEGYNKDGYIKEIIKKPNMTNGKIYELLVYDWLTEAYIDFGIQYPVEAKDCLKKNDYDADGFFEEGGTVFEIKRFGIGSNGYNVLRKKMQEYVDKDHQKYTVTIDGNKNLDTKTIEKELISQAKDLSEKLIKQGKYIQGKYIYEIQKYDITLIATPNTKYNMSIEHSHVDYTRWAQENELYFFRKASQFSINKPHMLICPFTPQDILFDTNDVSTLYQAFRYLSRRMFMKLINDDRLLNTIDGKAKEHIPLKIVAKKLSAVMFIDISRDSTYEDCRCWLYLNPNADYPIPNYFVNKFRLLGAYVDDFAYDTY